MGGTNSGRAYVVLAAGYLEGAFEIGSGISDYVIDGKEEGDFSGYVFSGDLDADGVPEMMVSALGADGPDNLSDRAGEIRVFFNEKGRPSGRSARLDITVHGEGKGDRFGWQPAAGDLNGDGFVELIVAVASGDGPLDDRPSSGEVTVVFPPVFDVDEDEDGDEDEGSDEDDDGPGAPVKERVEKGKRFSFLR